MRLKFVVLLLPRFVHYIGYLQVELVTLQVIHEIRLPSRVHRVEDLAVPKAYVFIVAKVAPVEFVRGVILKNAYIRVTHVHIESAHRANAVRPRWHGGLLKVSTFKYIEDT